MGNAIVLYSFPMISASNLEKLLRAARKHRVSKIFLDKGEVSAIEFFDKRSLPQTGPKEIQTVDELKALQMPDMPSDEELRYLSADYVPSHLIKEESPN